MNREKETYKKKALNYKLGKIKTGERGTALGYQVGCHLNICILKNLHLFYVTYYVAKSQQLPSIGEREQAGNHLGYRYHGKVDWAN